MGKYDLDSMALDARKDGKAFRALLEASAYIIEREVKRFATGYNSCHYDEYQAEAITSLYNNLYRYEPEKGAFSSFISRCIDQAILDYIREKQNIMSFGSTKLNEIKNLNKARRTIKEEGLEFAGEDSFEDDVYQEEKIRALYKAISTLSREERNIIVYSFGLLGKEKMSNKKMAKILKVSENTIVNRKNAIKAKIRIMMESWAA